MGWMKWILGCIYIRSNCWRFLVADHRIADKKIVPEIGDNGYVIGKYDRLNYDRCSVNSQEDGDLKRWSLQIRQFGII